ncbi:uncharacterized protein G2W53_005435 [Senna tora]|uniref:Uncharacterized protein n=1 Tax=Senna tora TaxID=362788 RepID=A0A834X3L2_9FABA|nr:uncharacterized protein G2W53_005435 [Senna tora]
MAAASPIVFDQLSLLNVQVR